MANRYKLIHSGKEVTALAAASGTDKGKYIKANASTGALEYATVAGGGDFMADGSVAMTGDLNMNSQDIQTPNEVFFKTNPTVSSFTEGKLYYDKDWKTLSCDIDTDVILQIGQETMAYCYNGTGAPITNGKVVYVTGAFNGVPSIALAQANSSTTSNVLGVVTNISIANGDYGFVTIRGQVNNLDTTGTPESETWSAGDILYLSSETAGSFTNIQPSAGARDVRVARVMIKDATTGRVFVNLRAETSLNDLSDVTITTPTLDEVVRYNGVEWVNGPAATSSASSGIEFFQATPSITAVGGNNALQILTLSKTPVTTAEQVIGPITVGNATVPMAAWIYDTALGRTSIDAGVWDFETYAAVSSTTAGRVSSITRQVYSILPQDGAAITVNIVNTAGVGVVTASGGTPFATTKIDASATNTTASYIQTPAGIYQITARTSDTVCTIACPAGKANETGVIFNVWKKLFGVTTPTITTTGTNYSPFPVSTAQSAFTITMSHKFGSIMFGTSNTAGVTITSTYNGTARNTHFSTPLITLHNNLAGLQGGSGNEMYHLSAAEYTVTASTGSGAMARLTSPAFTTPNIGSATGSISGNAGTVTNGIYTTSDATALAATTAGNKDKYLHSNASTGVLEWSAVAGSGATIALDNLANVAINAALVLGTSDAFALGSATKMWSDLFLAAGGVINFNNGNATLTHSTGLLTSNVPLSLGTSNALTCGTIELGAAADTTIARVSAGVVSIEGANILVSGGALGTPSSGTVTNLTGTASININGTVGATTPTTIVGTTIQANTGFVPDANDGAYLGTTALGFSDLFLATGGVINWANGEVTLTGGGDLLTLAGGNLALGTNSLTMTGSIGATGARVTKGWFTDLEATNQPTFNGTKLPNGTGSANEITYWSGTNTIGTLAVATYPSLTELAYVKGVTSAIQTQLNAKGVGDMVLASTQSVTGAKTFDKDKLLVKGTSTGTTNITTANTSATNYTATLPAKDGTIAYTADVPVKASGAELDTATDDAKFATAKALKDSHNVPSVAPGTSGNVLTSNGTDWTSAAPSGVLISNTVFPQPLFISSGNTVVTSNQYTDRTLMRLTMVKIYDKITVNELTFNCAGISNGTTLKIAIFSENGQTKILEVESPTLTGAAVVTIALDSPVVINPGNYFIAALSTGASGSFSITSYNASTGVNSLHDVTGYTKLNGVYTVTADTIPDTITLASITANSVGAAYVRLDN